MEKTKKQKTLAIILFMEEKFIELDYINRDEKDIKYIVKVYSKIIRENFIVMVIYNIKTNKEIYLMEEQLKYDNNKYKHSYYNYKNYFDDAMKNIIYKNHILIYCEYIYDDKKFLDEKIKIINKLPRTFKNDEEKALFINDTFDYDNARHLRNHQTIKNKLCFYNLKDRKSKISKNITKKIPRLSAL